MVSYLLETRHPLSSSDLRPMSRWLTRLPSSVHTSKFRMDGDLVYSLCFLFLTDVPARRTLLNSFGINPLRALFIATEGVPPFRLRQLRCLDIQTCRRSEVQACRRGSYFHVR